MSDRPAVADLEQCLTAVAYVVLRHGDAYVPLLDRLEREIEAAKRQVSHRDRAQRILETMSVEVTRALVA